MAFRIPLIVKLKMPNPEPKSGNCDVVNIWNGNPQNNSVRQQTPNPIQINQQPVEQARVVPEMKEQEIVSNIVVPAVNINTGNEPLITVPINNDSNSQIKPVQIPQPNINNQKINNNEVQNQPLITVPINNDVESLDIDDIVNAPDNNDFNEDE